MIQYILNLLYWYLQIGLTYMSTGIKIPVLIDRLSNPICKLHHVDPSLYDYFNPCTFQYGDKIYTTHRLATGRFFSVYKIYEYFTKCSKYYPSLICISSAECTSIVNIPDVRYIEKYKNITQGRRYRFTGYEDARSVVIGDNICLIVNCFASSDAYTQLGVITIDAAHLTQNIITPTNFCLVHPDLINNCFQKNWMPFVQHDELYLVYSVSPHVVYRCNYATGEISLISNISNSLPNHIRGGSNVCKYVYNGVQCHISVVHVRRKNFYTHQLYCFSAVQPYTVLYISPEWIIHNGHLVYVHNLKYSYYFYLIQFVSGLSITNDVATVYYGTDNYCSNTFTIDRSQIDRMLVAL